MILPTTRLCIPPLHPSSTRRVSLRLLSTVPDAQLFIPPPSTHLEVSGCCVDIDFVTADGYSGILSFSNLASTFYELWHTINISKMNTILADLKLDHLCQAICYSQDNVLGLYQRHENS